MGLSKGSVRTIERLSLEGRDASLRGRRVDYGPIRAALVEACAELDIDVRRPGVPPVGTSLLDAVAERLELGGWQRARQEFDARRAAASAADAARAEARAALKELELNHARARAEAIDAGKSPPVPTDSQADAVSRLLGRLHLLDVGLGNAGVSLPLRAGHWPTLARAAVAPGEWPAMFLVMGAIVSRFVNAVEESDTYDGVLNSRNRDVQTEWHRLRAYAVRGAGCADDPERARECDAITWAWAAIWTRMERTRRDPLAELVAG